jgi:hypothetical protein
VSFRFVHRPTGAEGRPTLQGELDWIVMMALEKDRTRRYETADGVAADILRHLAHEPVVAAPPSQAYRKRKFVRKHRGAVIAESLVFFALVGGTLPTSVIRKISPSGLASKIDAFAQVPLPCWIKIVRGWPILDRDLPALLVKKTGHRALLSLSAMPLFVSALAAENRFPGAPGQRPIRALFDQDVTARRRFFQCHRPASAPMAIKPRTTELGSGTEDTSAMAPRSPCE